MYTIICVSLEAKQCKSSVIYCSNSDNKIIKKSGCETLPFDKIEQGGEGEEK